MKNNSILTLRGELETMASKVEHYGPEYAPPLPQMEHTGLTTLLTESDNAISAARMLREELNAAVNHRKVVFKDLPKIMTRITDTLKTCGASQETIDDMLYYRRKITGDRAKPVPNADGTTPPDAPEDGQPTEATGDAPVTPVNGTDSLVKKISVSQLSFNSRTGNFEGALNVLDVVQANYPVQSGSLSQAELHARLQLMKDSNAAVLALQTAYSNALTARNMKLFGPNGLVLIGRAVKKHVRGLYGGITSPQYKQLKSLRFAMLVKLK